MATEMKRPDYATAFDGQTFLVNFLDLRGVGTVPRQATGFFWRRVDKVFLVTNWHVVAGRNIFDGKNLDSQSWMPESILLRYFEKIGEPDATGLRSNLIPSIKVPLYEDFHSPFWLQHPLTFEWNIDIVAIEIRLPDNNNVRCVNDSVYPKHFHFTGNDVFVVGHALPERTNAYPVPFPLWKRGSIASDLNVPWNMRPAFLIDSRTSPGMSGSPVFSRIFGPVALADKTINYESIVSTEFMGVYAGRVFDDENTASLGLVWHRHLIDEILDAPSPGSREWVPSKSIRLFDEFKKTQA
jgi:hypothetical protein